MNLAALKSATLRAPHGFYTRRGGVSDNIYASLQCGWGAQGDDHENVRENRARVAADLGVAADRLISAHQIHSALCVTATDSIRAFAPGEAPRADAWVTATPGIAIGVMTADCGPVLLEDADAGVVGAAHAGWRGALGDGGHGVLEATVAAMRALGAAPARIHAAIGPCIGPQSYEVGPEYAETFRAADPDYARFFTARAKSDRLLFDLPSFIAARLARLDLGRTDKIERCTYAEPDLFFSNRRALHRAEPDYGRLISAITPPRRTADHER